MIWKFTIKKWLTKVTHHILDSTELQVMNAFLPIMVYDDDLADDGLSDNDIEKGHQRLKLW